MLSFSSGHDNGDCSHVYLFTDTIFRHHRKYRHHDLNRVIPNTIHRHVVTFIFLDIKLYNCSSITEQIIIISLSSVTREVKSSPIKADFTV